MVGGGGDVYKHNAVRRRRTKDIQELRINTNDGIAFCV